MSVCPECGPTDHQNCPSRQDEDERLTFCFDTESDVPAGPGSAQEEDPLDKLASELDRVVAGEERKPSESPRLLQTHTKTPTKTRKY